MAEAPQEKPTPAPTRRLNVNLPASVADELEKLAKDSGRNMTEVVRTALGLVKLAHEVSKSKQKLVIADSNDKPIKEIILP
jgi:Arc/MetJ-type ribon-helix-helix transcriptional regulator